METNELFVTADALGDLIAVLRGATTPIQELAILSLIVDLAEDIKRHAMDSSSRVDEARRVIHHG